MPAFNSIVINDRESTPVAHTFEPIGSINGVNNYREYDSDGVVLGDNVLTTSMRQTEDRINGTLRLSVPVLQTTTDGDGNESYDVSRVARVRVEVSFDKSSTSQERANAVELARNALAAGIDQVNALFVENKSVY